MVNPINWRELDLAIYGYLYTYIGIGFEVVDGGPARGFDARYQAAQTTMRLKPIFGVAATNLRKFEKEFFDLVKRIAVGRRLSRMLDAIGKP